MDSGGFIPRELRRYQKQLMVPELGIKGQEKLKKAKVLLIGTGGLGCPVLQYLAAAGVGKIGIVEFDLVNETNLNEQIIYGSRNVGKLMSIIAKEYISQINDLVTIEILNLRLEPKNALDIIRNYDIIVDASNNTGTSYLVNDSSVILGKTMVFGSVYANVGWVSVFNYLGGTTFRCFRPSENQKDYTTESVKPGLLGVLPGLTGIYMANETIKVITGIGNLLSGKVLYFNIMDNKSNLIAIDNLPANHNITKLKDNY